MKKTAEFVKKNKGAKPSKEEQKEIKRIAVSAAAEEINGSDKKKAALKKTKRTEKKLVKKIKRDEKNMKKVADNLKIAAESKARREDRKLTAEKKRVQRKEIKKEAALSKADKAKFDAESAAKELAAADDELQKAKAEHARAVKTVSTDSDTVIKANLLLAKDKAAYEDSVKTKRDKDYFLDHIEDHEEEARMKNKSAKIKVAFEEEDAKKVKVLLKKMVAKRNAVDKFTKSLDKKSKRDYKASQVGIAKAKGDYAKAKTKFDKLTKEVAKHEAKIVKAKKQQKMANDGVVLGLKMGKNAKVIKSAESENYLDKRVKVYKKDVDREDVKAKGQQKMMSASMTELEKAEALQTLARKQKNRVKSDRETMAAQVKKIKFLKSEVKTHEANAMSAKKSAKESLIRVKTMRKKAIDARDKAVSKKEYLKKVDIPLVINERRKAKSDLKSDKYKMKKAEDRVEELEKKEKYLTEKEKKESTKNKIDQERAMKRRKQVTKAKSKEAKAANKIKISNAERTQEAKKAEGALKQYEKKATAVAKKVAGAVKKIGAKKKKPVPTAAPKATKSKGKAGAKKPKATKSKGKAKAKKPKSSKGKKKGKRL